MCEDMDLKSMFPYWGEVFGTLEDAIQRLNEKTADYRCSEKARSIREILVHVIDVFNRDLVEFILGGKSEKETQKKLDRMLVTVQNQKRILEDLLAHETVDFMSKTREFAGRPRTYGDALWNVLTEQIHHRGQIFMLMSSAGIKPPEI
ncbi:MAG: hypothetical protein C4K49_08700 [Candidatus Thorarchaeota archaeon]|nr:MAG: hypothetical protein C4K49_08700 [Candidatus Thorarchaeota archaeon]